MARYKIIFNKELCIGALPCTSISPEFFAPEATGTKVDLVNGVYNTETKTFEVIIDEKDFSLNKFAEDNCPVKAIQIVKIDE